MSTSILTDIEGTTSRVDFVHKVLFPYARQRIAEFVTTHCNDPVVSVPIEAVRHASGQPRAGVEQVIAILIDWIDQDQKISALKTLQGMIWQQGFTAGHFTAHVYADAVDALKRWQRRGYPLYVYSSGSVLAQQLFFRHSVFGDLTTLFSGYFDTDIGGKREVGSYRRIAQSIAQPASAILFLSDIEAELDAASSAGMQTVQVLRSDASPETHGRHPTVTSFTEIDALIRNKTAPNPAPNPT